MVLTTLEYSIAGIIIAIPIVILIIRFIERRIHEDKIIKRDIKNIEELRRYYLMEVIKINPAQKELAIKNITELSKEFFKDFYNIKNITGFKKLEKHFLKRNQKKEAKFCKRINLALYSQKYRMVDKARISRKLLYKIIKNAKPIAKKKQLKESHLNIVKIFGINKEKKEDKKSKSKQQKEKRQIKG